MDLSVLSTINAQVVLSFSSPTQLSQNDLHHAQLSLLTLQHFSIPWVLPTWPRRPGIRRHLSCESSCARKNQSIHVLWVCPIAYIEARSKDEFPNGKLYVRLPNFLAEKQYSDLHLSSWLTAHRQTLLYLLCWQDTRSLVQSFEDVRYRCIHTSGPRCQLCRSRNPRCPLYPTTWVTQ